MADFTLALKIRADGTAEVVRGLDQIEAGVRDVSREARQTGANTQTASRSFEALGKQASVAGSAMGLLKTALAGLGLAAVARDMVNTLSGFAALEGRLKTVTGSTAAAQQALRALTQEAATSPATVNQLADAYAKLAQRGLNASLEALRSWQNVAAGSQKSLDQWVEAVLDAVTGEGERLKEFGIRMSQTKDQVALSFGDMSLTVGKNAAEIEAALLQIANVKFAGGIEDQAGRLPQLFSNVRDAVDALWRALGDAGVTAALSAGLQGLISLLNGMADALRTNVIPALNELQSAGTQTFATLQATWNEVVASMPVALQSVIPSLVSQWHVLVEQLKSIFSTLPFAMLAGIEKFVKSVPVLWEMLKTQIMGPAGEDFGPSETTAQAMARLRAELTRISEEAQRQIASGAFNVEEVSRLTAAAAQLKAELPTLNTTLGQTAGAVNEVGKSAKDARSELEKLGVPFAKFFEEAGKVFGVNAKLIASVAKAESEFNAKALGPMTEKWGRAKGIMQIIDATWTKLGGKLGQWQFDPKESIMRGAKELGILIGEFKRLDMVLVAYNAGPERARAAIRAATERGTDPLKEFMRLFPRAAKETIPYIEKVVGNLEKFGSGAEAIELAVNAMEHLEEVSIVFESLNGKVSSFFREISNGTPSVDDMADATDMLATAAEEYADAVAVSTLGEKEATIQKQLLIAATKGMTEAQLAEYEANIRNAANLSESMQLRESWARSILQGFDQLWSNMITGAENAMEALQKTLKSWLLAIANWLLKQTLIIPITAAMFGVSQESLGGGLLSKLGGASGAAGGGGGGWLSSLSNLTTGHGMAGLFQDAFQGIGRLIGSEFLSLITVNAPNWMFGAAGLAGGLVGQSLFGGYGGVGGSVGGLLGTGIGSTIGALGWAGGPVGGLIGSLLGGALGGLFGNDQEITGGVGYYDFNRDMAGAAHPGTDPAVVDMMQKLGQTLKEMEQSLRSSSEEFADMWNFGASMWLDTDTAGRVDAAYNSYSRGLQKQSFQAAEDAARWFMEQMVEDVKKQGELHLPELANMMQGMNLDQFMAVIQNLGALKDAADVMDVGLETAYQTLTDLGQAGETLSQTWQRVATELGVVNLAMEGFRMPLLAMSPAGLKAADALVQLLGGLDGFTSATSYFYENFFTEAERQEIAVQRATDAVAEFNSAMGLSGDAYIDTRGELRAFVQGLDLTTEAGQRAFAAAMQVAPSIMTLVEALAGLGDEADIVKGIIEDLFGDLPQTGVAPIDKGIDGGGEPIAQWGGDPGSLLERYIRQALKPSDDLKSQTQKFFEEFYTPEERAIVQRETWQTQLDDFNNSLGLTGDAAIDTREEFRAYIESLDLTTEAGRAAYAEAMKLVEALLGLTGASGDAAKAAEEARQALWDQFAALREEWGGVKSTFADILNPDTRTSGERLRAYGQEAMALLEGIKDGWDAMELDRFRDTMTNLAAAARDAMAYLDQMQSAIRGLVSSTLDARREARQQEFQEWVGTLAPKAQTDIFKQQAAQSYRQGLAATDLGSLERAIGSFAENASRYIDSLTDPKEKAWAEINFERIMLAAQDKADRLAEAQREALRQAAEDMKNRIIEGFQEGGRLMLDAANAQINAANANLDAANTQVAAANAQQAAANTPIQVDVTVQTVTA